MKNRFWLRIIYITFLFLFVNCSTKNEKIVGVKMYELKDSVQTLISNWNKLGINTAFVSKQVAYDKNFRSLAKENNIDVFVIFPIYFNPEKLEKDSSLYAITNKGEIAKKDWVEFVCPTRNKYQTYIIEQAKNIVKETKPEGISIDFIRHFAFWEMITPDCPIDSIPETCFCNNCLATFQSETKNKLPKNLNTTEDKATWIRKNLREEWTKWKSDQITSFVKKFTQELKTEDSNLKFNLHAVPWKKDDYNGAGKNIVGQDIRALSEIVDYISPMCYSFMLYRSPEWIGSLINDFNKQGASNIIPSIQVKECYRSEKFPLNEFRKCVEESLKKPSQGVIFWSWDYIVQEPEKKKVIKEIIERQ